MSLDRKHVEQLKNIDVNTFSEEFKEDLRDIFEVVSYFLSQLEVEKDNGLLFTSKGRGEA